MGKKYQSVGKIPKSKVSIKNTDIQFGAHDTFLKWPSCTQSKY